MNVKKIFKDNLLNTYSRVGPLFAKGKGSWLWDVSGRRYLDLFPGWGVSILGHCHPRITRVIAGQAKKMIHLPNNLYQEEQALLAKEIVKNSFPSKVFFANSGAEAVEAALKFSRIYGRGRRHELITMKNSFHGRTFGALSATGQKKYKELFKPLLPGFKEVKFNDFSDFERKTSKKTVGVILELVQGEGGVNIAEKGYIAKVRAYCRENNLLFIVDEVQTGMGRTGKLFCYQNYGITPEIMILSKGLGAGIPISAIVVKKGIADLFKPGMHASTFGGSPLACRASREVFRVIKEESLLPHVKKMGEYVTGKIKKMKKRFPLIKKVKGMGLMVGVELACDAYPVFLRCLEKRLIVNSTQRNILRVMPALNVRRNELDRGLSILGGVFAKITQKS